MESISQFRRECKISTWIYRIALNTCISFIRKEKNIPEIVTLTQEPTGLKKPTRHKPCYGNSTG